MGKIYKVLLGILLSIAIFVISIFGTYKYNESKTFNNLASQGKQYMIQKDYDKAIEVFQQALSYKNDRDIQGNLALAQNLKNENNKKENISKDIQLANDAAKNNKYEEANKYLDEILKIDPNNTDAKNLKDIFAKAVQDQQEKAKYKLEAENTAKKNDNDNNNTHNEKHRAVSYKQALEIVENAYPDCYFQPAQEVVNINILKKLISDDMLNASYVFYGCESNPSGAALQDLILVTKENGHILELSPDGKIHPH
ncbi:hypothetical protein Ccar_24610 [Clostridium carboxidivorans P7]|uniref:TPR repeat-containing protein n=1 Tax=Clostridium carboxidivorans P7 TaxID=536227 RepID=C6PU44_9CLOT|nr:hypothetical protein [Clostridium carboxidivorans]AKN33837.1 hypothetical protein Ccar_24610 [Clostridium carboxidivorans P7]EET87244.1 hypothetical protein CcarbDRAFT_2311 [Clostridium carboxidivorans P7]EFG86550.1 tetratricopeptide repeat protein [Clostridium carboxidivorans P7]